MSAATFVHLKSESGDDFYFGIDAALTDEEVREYVRPRLGYDVLDETVYIEHIQRVGRPE